MKHPQSFQSSPLSQHPVPAANQNRDRPFFLDHPEIRGAYKPVQIDPRQDLTANRQRDNFSGFGPLLTCSAANPLPNTSLDRLLGTL